MRLPWAHQPVEPDRITVRELLAHGLDSHPDAIAILWSDSDVLVCRQHATEPGVVQLMSQLRPGGDVAVVLTSRYSGSKLVRQCVHCVVVGGYRRSVEARRARRR